MVRIVVLGLSLIIVAADAARAQDIAGTARKLRGSTSERGAFRATSTFCSGS
jgi:hypothetical protein